jgi:hypothetical protein
MSKDGKKYDANFTAVFDTLNLFISEKNKSERRIGFEQ